MEVKSRNSPAAKEVIRSKKGACFKHKNDSLIPKRRRLVKSMMFDFIASAFFGSSCLRPLSKPQEYKSASTCCITRVATKTGSWFKPKKGSVFPRKKRSVKRMMFGYLVQSEKPLVKGSVRNQSFERQNRAKKEQKKKTAMEVKSRNSPAAEEVIRFKKGPCFKHKNDSLIPKRRRLVKSMMFDFIASAFCGSSCLRPSNPREYNSASTCCITRVAVIILVAVVLFYLGIGASFSDMETKLNSVEDRTKTGSWFKPKKGSVFPRKKRSVKRMMFGYLVQSEKPLVKGSVRNQSFERQNRAKKEQKKKTAMEVKSRNSPAAEEVIRFKKGPCFKHKNDSLIPKRRRLVKSMMFDFIASAFCGSSCLRFPSNPREYNSANILNKVRIS
ncbi:hypothetical protein SADUNF_Sadunf02G0064900 [Salix dunnii]|uniref:Transmembrane protein n=1 Tax=Salix dunnii TaxID=1413687 RepID=A0A835N6N6_9ROSI|nr:hypothetical protein SADUNF_Sadunf02G0064900 [Salix dunnii]